MYLPSLKETKQTRDGITTFAGLCKTNECSENEFRAMHNMSLKDFPHISTRQRRALSSLYFTNIKGILGGETLYIASTNKITIINAGGVVSTVSTTLTNTDKTLVKMGNYLCIFPDKKVLKEGTISAMENTFSGTSVTFSLTNAKGEVITYHNAAYYEEHDPQDGDYLLTEVDGVNELQQYSSTSDTWTVITTAYVMAAATGIGTGFNKDDGVKISLNLGQNTWDEVGKVLPNEENGVHYATYPLKDVSANAITFSGLITATKALSDVTFKVERKTPDIAYVTEANNRLWACKADGTEIYATALGDPFNWNKFEGISTDSWAVTVGSDGVFTGAITYLGYPTFFKENSLIKIAIASNGAHQTKETVCRGVQKGCSASLCVVNEILYYKAQTAIVAYDGSLPQSISKKLGDMTAFKNCVGGRNKELYYIVGTTGTTQTIYVFDTLKGVWVEDDSTDYKLFTTWNNVLVGVVGSSLHLFDNTALSTTPEAYEDVAWAFETNSIDYNTPDAKYIHKITIKAYMEAKALARVWVKYDDGEYIHLFDMKSVGTRVYPMYIIPRRCDRFTIKVEGRGNVTIEQIVKSLEQGSDLY